ncbi:hypothetical protein [Paludifilum halophilum]|uniref:hypothetical protein n=1 Tax=Paludifilum halophilum TaxID=1642702 RepID=UPI00146E6432|nr:hypothetical protein [Paludifilum halophilum]
MIILDDFSTEEEWAEAEKAQRMEGQTGEIQPLPPAAPDRPLVLRRIFRSQDEGDG